jgi:hypothetical protein
MKQRQKRNNKKGILTDRQVKNDMGLLNGMDIFLISNIASSSKKGRCMYTETEC